MARPTLQPPILCERLGTEEHGLFLALKPWLTEEDIREVGLATWEWNSGVYVVEAVIEDIRVLRDSKKAWKAHETLNLACCSRPWTSSMPADQHRQRVLANGMWIHAAHGRAAWCSNDETAQVVALVRSAIELGSEFEVAAAQLLSWRITVASVEDARGFFGLGLLRLGLRLGVESAELEDLTSWILKAERIEVEDNAMLVWSDTWLCRTTNDDQRSEEWLVLAREILSGLFSCDSKASLQLSIHLMGWLAWTPNSDESMHEVWVRDLPDRRLHLRRTQDGVTLTHERDGHRLGDSQEFDSIADALQIVQEKHPVDRYFWWRGASEEDLADARAMHTSLEDNCFLKRPEL